MTRKNAKQKFFVYLFKANNLKKLKVLMLFFSPIYLLFHLTVSYFRMQKMK